MPSERFVAALNEQIAREFAASHQYTAMGAYYEAETFPRLAKFFFDQGDEERGHAMRMVNHLLASGAALDLREVPAPQSRFADHVEPIRLALENERSVTVEIGRLFDLARETRDHAGEVFMQWFVEEQVEEEATMESLLKVAERVREFPMMLEEFLARDGDELGSARGPVGG
ncbi:MAG TPA: ferritin [Thermoleophilaceae bacterium]|nr:ferritin [Thermoleophilaceae bacterium]